MRHSLLVLAIAAGVVSPVSSAQSAGGSDTRIPKTVAAPAPPASAPPASKAQRAMAGFTSLLREAALQSQATQRAAASKPVAPPAPPASDRRDALASTPDPGALH